MLWFILVCLFGLLGFVRGMRKARERSMYLYGYRVRREYPHEWFV